MNHLYLVRHGENRANLTKEFSNRLVDYPLTPKGRLQAEQTAQAFKTREIHEIYSSPLKRAIETAEIISRAVNVNVVVLEQFRELNVGLLETQPVSEKNWKLHNRIIEDWFAGNHSLAFPEGEDYITLAGRFREGIDQIVANKSDRNILVVGHGGIFTIGLHAVFEDAGMNWLPNQTQHNCSITELAVSLCDGQREIQLVEFASCRHLQGAAAELEHPVPDFMSKMREIEPRNP